MDRDLIGLRGYIIDTPACGTLRGERNGALIIQDGRIIARGNYENLTREFPAVAEWIDDGEVAIFSGLIDCHTHLPHYPAVARGESELLPWLRDTIFPIEREFTGPRAREETPLFFQELARNGTTTAAVFAAIYEESCDAAFEAAQGSGLGAIIGKMMMNIGSYGTLQPEEALSVSLNARALRPAEAFYLGTHGGGGARALGKSNIIGTLDVGKDADLTLINLRLARPIVAMKHQKFPPKTWSRSAFTAADRKQPPPPMCAAAAFTGAIAPPLDD